jgi:hypothetical protein
MIGEVTADDVQRVAEKHIRPDEMAIVIVGDAEEVLPQARVYGLSVEVFDTEGLPQDISKYDQSPETGTAEAAGNWDLKIDFQGQTLPVSLRLQQQETSLTGSLNTMLGDGTISDGHVDGNKISATARAEIQGQVLEFAISGKIDGDSMSGTITTTMAPEPLPFVGSRDGTAQKSAA